MKALYVPAGLLALILGFSLWAGRYVEIRTEQWNAALELADQSAAQENWTEAARRLEQVTVSRYSEGKRYAKSNSAALWSTKG